MSFAELIGSIGVALLLLAYLLELTNRLPNGTPVSLTFVGRLYDEETLLRVANAYQKATPHHLKHPALG